MKNNSEPAFPQPGVLSADGIVSSQDYCEGGMTLRDYFAAKAMQGIVYALQQGIRPADISIMCADSYAIADAMLKVRKEE